MVLREPLSEEQVIGTTGQCPAGWLTLMVAFLPNAGVSARMKDGDYR